MDHLGICQFAFFGKLHRRLVCPQADGAAPERVVAGALSQIGHRPENPDVMYDSGRDVLAKEFRERRPEVSMQTIEKYLRSLYGARPDFVYRVSREFVRNCQAPMLVLPDNTPAHVASLAPNADIAVYLGKIPRN